MQVHASVLCLGALTSRCLLRQMASSLLPPQGRQHANVLQGWGRPQVQSMEHVAQVLEVGLEVLHPPFA